MSDQLNKPLESLKMAHKNGTPWSLETLKLAHKNGQTWHIDVCHGAAERGDLECLKYMKMVVLGQK